MLVWLTLPFYDFCGFRSVAVNTVYKLQFFTFITSSSLNFGLTGNLLESLQTGPSVQNITSMKNWSTDSQAGFAVNQTNSVEALKEKKLKWYILYTLLTVLK